MVGDIFERGGKPDTIGRASCLDVYLFEDGLAAIQNRVLLCGRGRGFLFV